MTRKTKRKVETVQEAAVRSGAIMPPVEDDEAPGDLNAKLRSIYDLEERVERARAAFARATLDRKNAKDHLSDCEAALALEIREQRMGPGPLFAEDEDVVIVDADEFEA